MLPIDKAVAKSREAVLAAMNEMVLINSKWVAPHVSKPTIFFILGLGYVGYELLAIRAILLEFPLWAEWLTELAGPPPGRLLLSIIAFLVLTLRLAVAIDKHLKPNPIK